MSVLQKSYHNHQVFYDSVLTHRWYDVIGPNVRKFALVDHYHSTSCTVTDVSAGAGTSAITGVASALKGGWIFTSAANEDDGIQMQAQSEMNYLVGPFPFYFGARFQLSDADQSDAFLGIAISDTTILAGCTDDAGFRVADGSASLTFLLEKNNAETIATLATLSDATYVTVEMVYDGAYLYYYLNDALVGSYSIDEANFPDDEHLAPSLAFLTGDAGVDTMTVQWARWFQIFE
jgi:hypothetical protein